VHAPCSVAPSPSPRLFRVESRSLFLHYTSLSCVHSSDLSVSSQLLRCSTSRFRLDFDPPVSGTPSRVLRRLHSPQASLPEYGCGPVSLLSQPPSHAPSLPLLVSHILSRRPPVTTQSTPWRAAVRVPTSSACTTASARRSARAASASSSRAPTCSTSSRSPSSSSRARAMLPNCATSTAHTRSSWAAVSADFPCPFTACFVEPYQHQRLYISPHTRQPS
jgi:hypothetical protein